MSQTYLVDTGPLVALLDRSEPHHGWVVGQLEQVASPLATCESVLSGAAHLVRRGGGRPASVAELVRTGVLSVPFRLGEQAADLERLLTRYSDVPMSLADACLVRMSELIPGSILTTFDADFLRYRRHGRQLIPTLMP